MPLLLHAHMRTDHLIPGLIFLGGSCNMQQSGIKAGQVATLCKWASISPHLLCGSLSVNVYLQCASHLTMEEKVQQHVCINFCFWLGKTGAETYKMLQAAFEESCLSQLKTFEWYSLFKSGCRSFEDDPCPGRPSASHTKTLAHVREIICTDRCLSERLQRKLE